MILYLENVSGLRPEDLLARPGKNGDDSVRGPLVSADQADGPLSSLVNGDKLHIVGKGDEHAISGHTPEELTTLIGRLGFSKEVRLKQVHLIADRTGADGNASYASQLAAALAEAEFLADEIKAPLGDVRCDEHGKIWVRLSNDAEWQPSSSALNYYAGPNIQDKHRQ